MLDKLIKSIKGISNSCLYYRRLISNKIFSLRLQVFSLALSIFWIMVLFFILSSSISYNLHSPSIKMRAIKNILLPEGWAFFTADPKQLLLEVYEVNQDQIKKLDFIGNRSQSLLGLNRKMRILF